LFYDRDISKFIDNFLKLFHRNFWIRDFPSPESDANFDFVAFFEPAACILDFELRMVFVRFGAQLDLFDFDLLLRFASFALLFRLFVDELAKIHNSGDRRLSVWRYFHQIKFGLLGKPDGLHCLQDTQVASLGIDNSHFRDTDFSIHAILLLTDGDLLEIYDTSNNRLGIIT
jgi:hypothetical protein